MVCGKFLDTGKILLGEEENKTEVLWLNRHSSRLLRFRVGICMYFPAFVLLCAENHLQSTSPAGGLGYSVAQNSPTWP